MAIFNDLVYARPIPQYVPLPLDRIDDYAGYLQGKYDLGKDAADSLLAQLSNIQVRDINQPVVDATLNKANAALEELAQRGDYESAGPQILKLAREIGTDPMLRAAVQDKKAYDDYLAQMDEARKNISDPERFNTARSYSETMNNKPVTVDPVTGAYSNIFQGYTPVKTPDVSKDVIALIDKVNKDNKPYQIGKDAKGNPIFMTKVNNSYYVTGQEKGVSEAEAAQIVTRYMMTDPTIAAYYKEGYMLDRFKNMYDPNIGDYRGITVDDFGGQEAFDKAAIASNMDPAAISGDPKKMEELYQAYYLNKQIGAAASPYVEALAHDDVEFKYHQDPEFLNRQRSELALRNSLAGIAAKEAADKRMLDYKYKKDEEKEKRANAQVVVANVPTEAAMNYAVAEESSEAIRTDLKRLEQKEALAAQPGSTVTFTPQEASQKIELQNKLRALEAEQKAYMNAAALTTEGLQAIDDQWRAYEKASNGRTEISKNDFYNYAKRGEFPDPSKIKQYEPPSPSTAGFAQSMGGLTQGKTVEIDDPKDYRTFLKKAKNQLAKQANIAKAANDKQEALDAEGYFGFFTGTAGGNEKDMVNNPKIQTVDRISQGLSRQVFAAGGVGYDVIGSGKKLDEVMSDLQLKMLDEEEGKATMNNKPVTVHMVPLNPKSNFKDVMYQMVIKDNKTGVTLKSFRVMPENQAFHADLMRGFNADLAEAYPAETEIGKNARTAIAHYDLPQFNLERDLKILDSEVNEKTAEGIYSVGTLVNAPRGQGNWVSVKKNAAVPKAFKNGVPIAVKQPSYQIVRVQDNIPPDIVLNNKNIHKYLYNPNAGISGNALLNSKRTIEALGEERTYAEKNLDYATGFPSLEDGFQTYYVTVNKGDYSAK